MGFSLPRRPVVLLVEDELLLRMDATAMVAEAGFEVVEAGDADEAIAILESRRDIGIVFTDIQMPGSMDGLKLAHAIRGRWPPIRIVATSGLVDVGEKDLPEGGRCRNHTTRNKLPGFCSSRSDNTLPGCHCGAREVRFLNRASDFIEE